MSKFDSIIAKIDADYSSKVMLFGANHQGVDWNSQQSQETRFKQLLKICELDSHFSIIDFGCEYAYLGEYMQRQGFNFSKYIGFDISKTMIDIAISKCGHCEKFRFFNKSVKLPSSDYFVTSGIFNIKLDCSQTEWERYILDTIHIFNQYSHKGFGFNMLTDYSDINLRKDYLYYANPCFYFDYCKRHFSRNIALLHNYDLYEFTILVFKGGINQ